MAMMRAMALSVLVTSAVALTACSETAREPEWTQLGEWTGQDSVLTEQFTMGGDSLRLAWKTDFGKYAGGNLLQVYVVDSAGTPFTLPVNWSGYREDTTEVVLQPGHRYKLMIRPTNTTYRVVAEYQK